MVSRDYVTVTVMTPLRILADENIDDEVVERLHADGHDVAFVKERVRSVVDATVLADATAEGRIILTGDRDFGTMLHRDRLSAPYGVVLHRLDGRYSAAERAVIIGDAFAARGREFVGHYTVIAADGGVRVRELPK